jgi:hypothetical protein
MTYALIHMDGTRLMGRWSDLTESRAHCRPNPTSSSTTEEFRGNLGHIGIIGTHEFILPLVAGENRSAYGQPALDNPYIVGAHQQGGLAGFMHPYLSLPKTPAAAASTLIALDAALELGDYYDIGALYSDEIGSRGLLLSFAQRRIRIPATAGTDQFSDVFRDPPPGSDRTVRAGRRSVHRAIVARRGQARADVHVDRSDHSDRRQRPSLRATRSPSRPTHRLPCTSKSTSGRSPAWTRCR